MAQYIIKDLTVTALLMVFILLPSHLTYAGQFGPPEPIASEGKVSLGVGYFYFSGRLNAENPGELFSAQQEIEQEQIYFQASYGLIKNWELSLRLGAPYLKLDNAFDVTGLQGVGGSQRTSDDFKDGRSIFEDVDA